MTVKKTTKKTAKKITKKTAKKIVKIGKGKKALKFKEGALHAQLDVPNGQKIPEPKKAAALDGKYGELAKKRANFAFSGALAAGRETMKKTEAAKPKSTDSAAKRKKFAAMQKAKKEMSR